MKRKTILAILVSAAMAGSLLAGCGGGAAKTEKTASSSAVAESAAVSTSEEKAESTSTSKEAEAESASTSAESASTSEEKAESTSTSKEAEAESVSTSAESASTSEEKAESTSTSEEAEAESASTSAESASTSEKKAESTSTSEEAEAESTSTSEEAEAESTSTSEDVAAESTSTSEEAEEAKASEDTEKDAPAEEAESTSTSEEAEAESTSTSEEAEAESASTSEEAEAESNSTSEEAAVAVSEAKEDAEVEASGEYKIGFSQATMASPFYVTMVDEFEKYCEEKGVEPMAISADEDVQKQNQDIMDMIAAGIDALILNPINLESVQTGIDACVEADIPVITVDRMASSGGTAVVKRDNYEMGRLTGEALLEALGGADKAEGTILELQGTAGDQVMMDRRDGFESVFEDVEGIKIVQSVNCDYVRAKALTAAQDMIQGNDNIVAIYGHNDDMAMGGLQAAQEAGLEDVLVCGVDGLMEAVEAIANGEGYVATTLNDPGTELKVAADTALKVLNGEEFEKEVDAGTGLIDTSNAADYVDDTLSFAAMKGDEEAAAPAEEKATSEEEEKATSEEEVKAASEEEEKATSEEEVKAASEEEEKATSEEEVKAVSEEEKKATSEEEVKAVSEEEEKATSEEDVKAASEEEEKATSAEDDKAAGAAAVAAVGEVVPADTYKIGFSQATMASPFYVTMVDEFENYCKEKGVEPMAISADEDVQKQNQDIMDMIAAGIDALILNPINLESVQTGIDACVEAGIPVITVDRMASSGGTAVVKRDNYEMGRLTGEALLEALGGADKAEGTILELQGTAGDQVMMDRRDGFESVFKDVKGIKIVQSVNCDYVRAKALTAAQDMIQGNDNIVAIYGHNDDMAMGGLQAAQEAGLEGVMVCGVDGLMEAVEAIADGEGYVATTLNDPGTELKVAADTAIKVLNGEEYEEEVDAGTGLIDASNAADYVDDSLSFAAMK